MYNRQRHTHTLNFTNLSVIAFTELDKTYTETYTETGTQTYKQTGPISYMRPLAREEIRSSRTELSY